MFFQLPTSRPWTQQPVIIKPCHATNYVLGRHSTQHASSLYISCDNHDRVLVWLSQKMDMATMHQFLSNCRCQVSIGISRCNAWYVYGEICHHRCGCYSTCQGIRVHAFFVIWSRKRLLHKVCNSQWCILTFILLLSGRTLRCLFVYYTDYLVSVFKKGLVSPARICCFQENFLPIISMDVFWYLVHKFPGAV